MGDQSDPIARALDSLSREVAALNRRIAELEHKAGESGKGRTRPAEEEKSVEYAGPVT
jgi:hypothetical protein